MKILIFWDVYWRIGRKALKKELPILKEKYSPDFVIVNIENASSGRGPIEKHAEFFENLWIDVMTSWDHIFDNEEKIKNFLNKDNSKLIRPLNFYESKDFEIPWKWYKVIEKNGKKLLVINLMSETFMKYNLANPFLVIKNFLSNLQEKFDAIIIDYHKEVTSEIQALRFFLDWWVSFIFWTHTHVQTNDEFISEKWTWIITDVWMVGPYPSVIWADFSSLEKRFLTWITKWKIEQSLVKSYLVNWVFVEIENFKTKKIEKIRILSSL